MALSLNKLVNDVFKIVENTFEETIIRVYIVRDVPTDYVPGSGTDPSLGSGSEAFRAIRKAVRGERVKLPEYEAGMVDILLPLQDLSKPVGLGDVIETEDLVYKVMRSDVDPADVTQTLMCKVV